MKECKDLGTDEIHSPIKEKAQFNFCILYTGAPQGIGKPVVLNHVCVCVCKVYMDGTSLGNNSATSRKVEGEHA